MITAKLRGIEYYFETKPGLFSKEKVDAGSRLLIENMQINPEDTVLDLGCGWGVIGIVAATLAKNGKVFMVDIDIRALKYSRINAEMNKINNVEIIASDAFENVPQSIKYNVIVSNPPSHTPKETIIDFVQGAKKQLLKGGKLYFVTERRIKPMVKREFEKVFGNYEAIKSNPQYVLSLARQN